MERWAKALCVVALPGLVACTSSSEVDDEPPSIGGIDAPAVVDPSFDPFATDPSTSPASTRDATTRD